MGGRGWKSAAFCPVLLLISSVDIGFFKNGRPFFPFCVSGATDGTDRVAGSLASLLLACGLLPGFCCRSVGATNDDVDFVCLDAARAGLKEKPVFMGGGGGFDLESVLSGTWLWV